MITAVKSVLESTLERAGIAKEKIARNAREEQTLITQRTALPIASLVTDPGRFEDPELKAVSLRIEGGTLYRQVRTKRVMPVVVKIAASDESEAGNYLSKFISNLPFVWEYQGIQGELEPTREEYSDYDSRMNARHKAAVVVEFSVDVGPEGTRAEKIEGIDEQEGAYVRSK